MSRILSKTAKRHRFNMDIDPDLAAGLAALAEQMHCPASGLAALAICKLIDDVNDGMDLQNYLSPCAKSHRYKYTIKTPKHAAH